MNALKLKIFEARGLLSMDSNGLSDPYCELHLRGQRFRTKVVQKSLNPVWEEEWLLPLSPDTTEQLEVSPFCCTIRWKSVLLLRGVSSLHYYLLPTFHQLNCSDSCVG